MHAQSGSSVPINHCFLFVVLQVLFFVSWFWIQQTHDGLDYFFWSRRSVERCERSRCWLLSSSRCCLLWFLFLFWSGCQVEFGFFVNLVLIRIVCRFWYCFWIEFECKIVNNNRSKNISVLFVQYCLFFIKNMNIIPLHFDTESQWLITQSYFFNSIECAHTIKTRILQ